MRLINILKVTLQGGLKNTYVKLTAYILYDGRGKPLPYT